MQIREDVSLEEEYQITSFSDLEEALTEKPEIAFITNPTNMHIPCAIACAKAGCHIFMEKPISDSLVGIDQLKEIIKESNTKLFVGYQNRYHPAIQAMKESLQTKEIGTILSIRAVVGERLVTMHTYIRNKHLFCLVICLQFRCRFGLIKDTSASLSPSKSARVNDYSWTRRVRSCVCRFIPRGSHPFDKHHRRLWIQNIRRADWGPEGPKGSGSLGFVAECSVF